VTEPDLIHLARSLAGADVTAVVQTASGGNSRVYKVMTAQKPYALKQYPAPVGDSRNRLDTERKALQLMAAHGIDSAPVWINAQAPYALMGWVEGDIVKAPQESDIDEAAIFLGTLHHISQKTPEGDMPPASEACVSGQVIIDQLEKRMDALMPHTHENPALMAFLSNRFMPAFTRRLRDAKKAYPDFTAPLPHATQTLIAADFGFHNIMRAPDGRLHFIDFEYFGWDDPVKLMCDFLLHPATPLTEAMRANFTNHALAIYGEGIAPRFASYYPLFGLRWALILLNEFIPERFQARQSARGDMAWDEVKTAQLAKAEAMLQMSEKCE